MKAVGLLMISAVPVGYLVLTGLLFARVRPLPNFVPQLAADLRKDVRDRVVAVTASGPNRRL